jgi:hypothetical protein
MGHNVQQNKAAVSIVAASVFCSIAHYALSGELARQRSVPDLGGSRRSQSYRPRGAIGPGIVGHDRGLLLATTTFRSEAAMKYLTVDEARDIPGLVLVLTAHMPAPWGESAKAIFKARNVPFVPVEQVAMGPNAELCAWTGGVRNAPIAMLDDNPPVHGWLDQ